MDGLYHLLSKLKKRDVRLPRLPNELLMEIAEHASRPYDRFKQTPEVVISRKTLWSMYKTTRLFHAVATKKLFAYVEIGTSVPSALARDMEILGRERIGARIKTLVVRLDGPKSVTHQNHTFGTWGLEDAEASSRSSQDLSILWKSAVEGHIRQLISLISEFGRLENLAVDALDLNNLTSAKSAALHFILTECLSTFQLPHIKSLTLQGVRLDVAARFWNCQRLQDSPIFRQNCERVRRLHFRPWDIENVYERDPNHTNETSDITTISKWIDSLQLRVLDVGDLNAYSMASLVKHSRLRKLKLTGLDISDSLSAALTILSPHLKVICIIGSKLNDRADRWGRVFTACLSIAWKEIFLCDLEYYVGAGECERGYTMCTPHKDDETALLGLLKDLEARKDYAAWPHGKKPRFCKFAHS